MKIRRFKQFNENRTATHAGYDLALFAENDEPVYLMALDKADIEDIFNFALARYKIVTKSELEYDDKETTFYDFAANFVMPEE